MHEVVDAHHHLWVRARTPQGWIDPRSMGAIDADFTAADLPARRHGVASTVVVQSASLWSESRELLETAASTAGRAARIDGAVVWADLVAPHLGDRLAELCAGPGGAHLVGVRSMVQAESDPAYLDRADVRAGIAAVGRAGLAYDLVVRADQLPAAARLAAALPDVRFVLDHLGKPRLERSAPSGTGGPDEARDADDHLASWRRDLTELAAAPNVTAKLSGLVTEARWDSWTLQDLRPAVDHALATFGPHRLMFGSDWPVCLLASGYGRWLTTATELLAGLSDAERGAVLAGTARRVYDLPRPASSSPATAPEPATEEAHP
ncbi:amidohydrolase family protein [Cellulosimicrobium arenosum]|uniref:Amidohydrolase family protein n=1 Tax=Cellulosimicrobium arenosum TaxID=2708133 RepID=A0A927GB88_9MICO|nr:amidohydrolase family protein [Cellulosimicrobium arenosum]